MTQPTTPQSPMIYGIMAEFVNPTDLSEAAHKAYAEGYRRMDAFTPISG